MRGERLPELPALDETGQILGFVEGATVAAAYLKQPTPVSRAAGSAPMSRARTAQLLLARPAQMGADRYLDQAARRLRSTALTNDQSGIGPVGPRILLALSQRDWPRAALTRVFDLARSLDVAVDALRVLPDRLRWLRWLPTSLLRPLVQRQIERSRPLARATRFALAPIYGEEPRPGQVVVRTGRFIDEITAHASRRAPLLIAVPPDERRLGSLVSQLALLSTCRVLVPRPACRQRTVLAASDLITRGLPVIREATGIAASLRMELVSFHNVDPLFDADGQPRDAPCLSERMSRASDSLSVLGRAAVRSGIDAAASILAEAREGQVDFIVVGVKARSPLERLVYGDVASRVVEGAECSVLVTPVST